MLYESKPRLTCFRWSDRLSWQPKLDQLPSVVAGNVSLTTDEVSLCRKAWPEFVKGDGRYRRLCDSAATVPPLTVSAAVSQGDEPHLAAPSQDQAAVQPLR